MALVVLLVAELGHLQLGSADLMAWVHLVKYSIKVYKGVLIIGEALLYNN